MKQNTQVAEITWQDDTPRSTAFDDIYYSLEDGLEESRYVFLTQNDLPRRWENKRYHTIAETGFGTGLNFLITADLWQKNRSSDAFLTYYSVEKFPLSHADLKLALENWPQFQFVSAGLLDQYPSSLPGYHRICFNELNLTLVLMVGDVVPMLGDLSTKIDSWFLDGFAPSRNPEMWSEEVAGLIAQNSHEATRFSTFTAAGFVRRNMEAVGFKVNKQAGFGRKREMLNGQFIGAVRATEKLPWFRLPSSNNTPVKHVTIIGAGLSGLTCAWVLESMGVQCQLIEAGSEVASGASGNKAGIVLPRFTLDQNIDSQFYVNSFLQSVSWYQKLHSLVESFSWHQSGVLQFLPESRLNQIRDLEFPEKLLTVLDALSVSEKCGFSIDQPALFYTEAGYLSPAVLCLQLSLQLERPVILNKTVSKIERKNHQWCVFDSENNLIQESDAVIFANGYSALHSGLCDSIQIQQSRGQVTYVDADEIEQTFQTPLCYDGYVVPAIEDICCIGASYDNYNGSLELSLEAQENNLRQFNRSTGIQLDKPKLMMDGRASFRTTSDDHLPVVGPLMDEAFYQENYSDLHHGRPVTGYPDAEYHAGLFISSGHGSRGLVSCYSSACYLASLICSKPVEMPQSMIHALHPARFLIRQLKKKRLT